VSAAMLFSLLIRHGHVGVADVALEFPFPLHLFRHSHPLAVVDVLTVGTCELISSRAVSWNSTDLGRSDRELVLGAPLREGFECRLRTFAVLNRICDRRHPTGIGHTKKLNGTVSGAGLYISTAGNEILDATVAEDSERSATVRAGAVNQASRGTSAVSEQRSALTPMMMCYAKSEQGNNATQFIQGQGTAMTERVALIVGAGPGISAAFAEALVADGYQVALASRNLDRLQPLAKAIGATPFEADASSARSLVRLFDEVDRSLGQPDVVLYNPSARIRGELLSLDMGAASAAIQATAVGALVTAQEAARRMLPRGSGSIFFTGATAGIKGFARSSVFAMGKFAVRGLAQSLARELGPAGIHVVHFIIDGTVDQGHREPGAFTPQAIARSYMAALAQPRGAWSWEFELRSHTEPF